MEISEHRVQSMLERFKSLKRNSIANDFINYYFPRKTTFKLQLAKLILLNENLLSDNKRLVIKEVVKMSLTEN